MIAIINFITIINGGYVKNNLTDICEIDYTFMEARDMVSFAIGCTEVNRVRLYSEEKLMEIVGKYVR